MLHGDNFVVRTRALWVRRGYAVLIPDTVNRSNLRGIRSSSEYAALVEDLVDVARRQAAGPVFLLGTSQGSIAAMNGAAHAAAGTIAGVFTHMMTKRAELELLDAISVYFHHATPGLGPDVEIYQNAEWGLRQRDKAVRGMHYFDGVLRTQPFVAGEFFSMADITVIGGLIFAEIVKLPVPAECEALQAWYTRMQERPSVKSRVTMSEAAR